uniref:CYTH domain-containing protein n=1 Tax=Fervidobacterium thailandense TaxID=1008305 RepID=A0A7C4VTM0_9BACT
MLEREWKFLVRRDELRRLQESVEKPIRKTVGIVQWYFPAEDKSTEKRLRLEIMKQQTGMLTRWILTEKVNTDDSSVRFETERFVEPSEELLNEIKSAKVVVKQRYFLCEDPEVVIDEFLSFGDIKYEFNSENILLLEVEEKSQNIGNPEDVKELLMKFGISNVEPLWGQHAEMFKNKNLAVTTSLDPFEIIEYVRNRLLGAVFVVMAVGTSVLGLLNPKNTEGKNDGKNNTNNNPVEFLKNYAECFARSLQTAENNECHHKLAAELDLIKLLSNKGFRISRIYAMTNRPFLDEDSEINKKHLESLKQVLEDPKFAGDKKLTSILEEPNAPIQYLILKFILTLAGFEVMNMPLDYNVRTLQGASKVFKEVWRHMDKISAIAEEYGAEIIIEAASGPRLTAMALQLWALFNQKDSYIKYEGARETTRIPAVGIDWDLNYVDELASLLSAVLDKSDEVTESEFLRLPNEVARLFNRVSYVDTNNGGKKVYGGFYSFYNLSSIRKKYLDKKEMPFGYGESFINVIPQDTLSRRYLRTYLENGIIRKWSYLWIGDLIPETVEHSQRHSKRLMEFTKNLLNVMGEDFFLAPFSRGELEKEFVPGVSYRDLLYFILIVALNVHDLGHVYPKFVTPSGLIFHLDGLPSAIRDLHSELTVKLIEDRNYDILGFETAFRDNVPSLVYIFNGREKASLVEEAIKVVCRYHRGYALVDEPIKSESEFIRIFELDTRSAVDIVNEKFAGDETLQKIILFLIRWLKFIDGTDVQADRVVTESYHKNRILRTRNESLHLIERIEFCENASVNDELIMDARRIILNEVKSRLEAYDPRTKLNNDELVSELDRLSSEIESKVYGFIETVKSSKTNGYVDIPYIVQVIDTIAFKIKQFGHFEKHKAVAAVFPTFFEFDNSKAKATLHVVIIGNKLVGDGEWKFSRNQTLLKVKQSIEDEFDKAKIGDEYRAKGFFDLELNIKIW